MLSDWNTLELQVMNQGGVRTEKLWFNFTIDRVHWANYAGKNFTDRQRIKRKAQRWANNYQSLPREERLAVLAAMMDIESSEKAEYLD
ncbi:(adenine-N6-)-methyltransferase homolog [hydrothermal vent metagenome]|uniref:(Adenine-N6-)-methyltransferase homolog n=1 Tax=hydrothermal vent metagenome TaxID=652676 RepID=A0A3B0ZAF7_9ZZZZ